METDEDDFSQSKEQVSLDNVPSGLVNKAPPSSSTLKTLIRRIWSLILEEYFLLGLGLVILIASQVQVPTAHQSLKETVVTYLCVSIIFFITGCTLKTRDLIDNYARWKLHLFVQVSCFFMTSAVIFGIVSACASNPNFMDPGILLGFILTGCTATTINSNVVMTREAHGNTALTVVQSTVGNFLGPFLTPLLFQMYTSGDAWYTRALPHNSGGYGEIYKRVFKQLGLSLFLPMVVGQVVQNVFPKLTKKIMIDFKIIRLSVLCLLTIMWQTYDSAFSTHAFTSVPPSNIIFLVFISIALFMMFNLIAFLTSIPWMPREDVVSVCYCTPAKSAAILVPISLTMFKGLYPQLLSKMQIPIVIYLGLQIAGGSILIHPFRKWVEKAKTNNFRMSQT